MNINKVYIKEGSDDGEEQTMQVAGIAIGFDAYGGDRHIAG